MSKELLNDMFDLRHRLEGMVKHLTSKRSRERVYNALRTVEDALCEEVDQQEKDEAEAILVDVGTLPQ